MKRFILFVVIILSCTAVNARKPLIGVSGYTEGSKNMVNTVYTNAVRLAGGIPVIVPVTGDDEVIEATVAAIDGLIMTGGADFDPLKWFGEEPINELGEIQPARDEFDVKLIRAAVKRGIPVLGICRGEQLMAVAFGGSLWQDIPSQIPASYVKHRQGSTPGSYGTHSIVIDANSTLAKVFGSTDYVVNSFHHQAINRIPKGFSVIARSADGIVEAVERTGALDAQFEDGGGIIIGVQFHPEALVGGGDKTSLMIFKYIVDASKTCDETDGCCD